jgi:hypothetical protein
MVTLGKIDMLSTPPKPLHAAKVVMPYLIFSKFKGNNCKKSLDQQLQPYTYINSKV